MILVAFFKTRSCQIPFLGMGGRGREIS